MLKLLRDNNRLNETLFIAVLMFFCVCLSAFRIIYTGKHSFLFLNWNLFLAFVPWVLSSVAVLHPNTRHKKTAIIILLLAWLLFFPNGPYILTDLFHIRMNTAMPIWFDLVLILSFAWTGLLLGFLSLWDIEKILKKSISRTWVSIISSVLLFIGSFGVYLGRYQRWNSWDVIDEPTGLFLDIGNQIMNPSDHPRTWGMTIILGLFLNILYWSFRLIKNRDE